MDVVYLVGPGRENKQLRYSLRSLANLEHDRVWIVGDWPSWVSTETIANRRTGSRYEHTSTSLRLAAEHPEVSEEFVLMNDDFYIMRPVEVRPLYRGVIGRSLDGRTTNHYSRHRLMLGDWLRAHGYDDPLDYDLHVPMVMTKSRVLEMAEVEAPIAPAQVFTRTLYGNLFGIGGSPLRDPKIRTKRDEWSEDWAYLSTTDTTFMHTAVGSHIRTVFSEEGPYERGRTPHPGRHAAPADGRNPNRHRVLSPDV